MKNRAQNKTNDSRANQYFGVKILINLLLIIIGSIMIAFFLRNMQNQAALVKQRENCEVILEETIEALHSNELDAKELTELFHNGYQSTLYDITELLTCGLYDSMADMTMEERTEVMQDILHRSGVPYLLIIDGNGRVLVSPSVEYTGKNLKELGLISEENLKLLANGTEDEYGTVIPAEERNASGDYFFYSKPMEVAGTRISIVLGVDIHDLDLQLSTLQDVDRILVRCAVSNNGFVFAVDANDHSFLYYENGDEVLTGRNTSETGLSESIYTNGYAGMEKINGVRYYCVSRSYGGNSYVCAVATTEGIFSNDKYVLFWSVTGFVIIMLLCLTYAFILRQDFVNKATETEQITLIKGKDQKPILVYDRTIGRRILPLMILCVLVLFGISFYTQTLMEISTAVSDSRIAISEVSARNRESQENRKLITDYYNKWYLSKAALLAYILEEDPSALNEASDLYYSAYDENNNKYYITDDEGNTLRSVRSSSVLKRLCDQNGLAAINIYEANGRLIATNVEDWYFTLGYDEEKQSYAFREVLDGKKDYLIQDPMVNEGGVLSQYIGVTFNYYTTVNEKGETIYVSRYDYEASLSEDWEGAPIHRHRSLLQINPDRDIVERLLASTDLAYIFSTDMLNGGFIVLFDNSEDHRVLYSPNQSSIGKTAASVGVSDKAFSGNSYGFQNVNGIEYFQYYFYTDGNFIATAIPKSGMYAARLPISLITAGVSLLLILILSATATLTTPDEELLYRQVTAQFRNVTDAKVFQIRMHSGKTSTTVKAAARWDNSTIRWKERTPEQKLITIVSYIAGIIILLIALSVILARKSSTNDSILTYILSGVWDRGLNIFAISACAILLIFTAIFISVAKVPISLVSSILGARSETVGHLMMSVIKYGGTLVTIFYSFYLLGLDPSSLLASAGILSLVIGLGAQSLIKDIIAGIFIVFEGEFRVGDIVTIQDFRGTVVDIGLRTTKIANGAGNIKIFSNSDISGVLNMTKQSSIALCTIGIEYGQDIEYVEAVMKRELPLIRERHPEVQDDPVLLGVSALSSSSVDLTIIAHCQEKDVYSVNRILNREVLMIFYRNGINVPFPNVTVSTLKNKEESK